MITGMKVTRNTPGQLIVSDTPWLVGILLIVFILIFAGVGLMMLADGLLAGLIFALGGGGMGVLAFAVFVRRVQVILDLPTNGITIRRQSLWGYSEIGHDLANLSGAVLETTTGSKGGTLYRPTLVLDRGMSAGRHPITQSYTNTRGPKRVVDAINDWHATAHTTRAERDAGTPADSADGEGV